MGRITERFGLIVSGQPCKDSQIRDREGWIEEEENLVIADLDRLLETLAFATERKVSTIRQKILQHYQLHEGKIMPHRQIGSFCIHGKQLDIHCTECNIPFLYKHGYTREQISKMTNAEIFKQVDILLDNN